MSDPSAGPADPKVPTPTDAGHATTKRQQPESDAGGATPAASSEGTPAKDPLRGSRTSGLWAGLIALGVVLVLVIIFIAQNTQTVSVTFLGWTGSAPLAVALLIATTAGLFLTAAAGSLRILQLRHRVRRERKG